MHIFYSNTWYSMCKKITRLSDESLADQATSYLEIY